MKGMVNQISGATYENVEYFSHICSEEFIDVPFGLPDIEQVVSIVVDYEVISLKVINTMRGLSYEGQYLSGKKLAAEIKLRQKILYAAERNTQSVYILENVFYQSVYIVIPSMIKGTDPAFLIKHKLLQCRINVENVFVRNIDKRRMFKSLYLAVSAVVSPTYEISYSMHYNSIYSSIFMMHIDGTHAAKITPGEESKNYRPLWSPLGREIAFVSNYNNNKLLNVYSLKTYSNTELTITSDFRSIGSYCWSIDGTKLIFSGYIDSSREIFSVCSNNTELKQLTSGRGMYESYKPKYSACGLKIAFIRLVSGLTDLWIMSPDGLNCVKLTSCGCVKYYDWSPDGKSIAYICSKNSKPDQMYIINTDNMKNESICIDIPLPHKKKVKFSPEGTKFAFIGTQLDTDDIYIYNLNDKRLINITNNCDNTKVSDFVWSADSDKIYFTANDLLYFNIYSISIENKHKFQLTSSTASKIELGYRPRIC